MVLPQGHSMLVVGPTQSGKTSSLVVPAILRWRGPLVVTSVKADVQRATETWRRRCGEVVTLAPGSDGGCTWDPLEAVSTHAQMVGVARDLASGTSPTRGHDTEFWNALAIRTLGALGWVVRRNGGTVFDLVAALEDRAFLDGPVLGSDEAARSLRGLAQMEPRTMDAVVTTAESLLVPWHLRQPTASLRELLAGANTVYFVAPRHEQRRSEGLLRAALSWLVADQHRRHEAGASAETLFVLDEAPSVAPLADLDQLAATGLGIGVTLLTVAQDFSQLEARWGERAPSIVNNHATRVVLSGLADHRAATFLPELAQPDRPPLRQWPQARAMVVSGRRAPTMTRVVPWWRSRRLRTRANEDHDS
jgi:type IV secretory pathway TraG/TraD family ATPase VirD4